MKDFSEQLSDTLTDFSKNLYTKLDEISESTANTLKKDISQNSPIGSREKLRKSWKIAKGSFAGLTHRFTIHSSEYRILHLVENGHVMRNGKRLEGSHFMKKAADKIIPEYEKAVEKAVQE